MGPTPMIKPTERADDVPRMIELRDLLGAGRRLLILHDGRRYALQLTRQNKLILTRDESMANAQDAVRNDKPDAERGEKKERG